MSPQELTVRCQPNGRLVITADPYTAATLAGRDGFRNTAALRAQLEDAIRDAWYVADCPKVP